MPTLPILTTHPAADRTCGRCAECCIHVRVAAFDKPAGVPCPKLRDGSGAVVGCCGVYGSRPHECRVYSCAWIDGFGTSALKPSRSGVLIEQGEIRGGRNVVVFYCFATRPGSLTPQVLAGIRQSMTAGQMAVLVDYDEAAGTAGIHSGRPWQFIGDPDAIEEFRAFMDEAAAEGVLRTNFAGEYRELPTR